MNDKYRFTSACDIMEAVYRFFFANYIYIQLASYMKDILWGEKFKRFLIIPFVRIIIQATENRAKFFAQISHNF